MDQVIEFAGNNIVLAGVWVALVAMLIFSSVSSLISSIKEVITHDATFMINKVDAVVSDLRAQKEFNAGHILGARQIILEAL